MGFVEVNERTSLIWYDTTVVCKSLALANIGLSSFMIGFQLYNRIGRRNIIDHHVYIYRNSKIIVNSIHAIEIPFIVKNPELSPRINIIVINTIVIIFFQCVTE